MAQQVQIHNRLDNAGFYREVIIADPVLSTLVTRFINAGPFTQGAWRSVRIPTMCHIISYVRYRRSGIDDPDIIKVRAAAMAECLGPGLNDDKYFPEPAARERIIAIGKWIKNNPREYGEVSTATAATYADSVNRITADNNLHLGAANLYAAHPEPNDDDDEMTIERALGLIIHLTIHATDWITDYELSSLVHLHMAIAKQGNVTTKFLSKIRTGVATDLQVNLDLSSALVKMFWNSFRLGITETNVEGLFANWDLWIPAQALRMQLVVQQTALTGLMILSTIGKAIKNHPTFPWTVIAAYYPTDAINYLEAVTLVGHNKYYGYKKDLGAAASTRYKNLGWVAYKVLLRANGMTTLNGYKGWPRTVPFEQQVTEIIDAYIDERVANILNPGLMNQANDTLNAIKLVVEHPDNAGIYA